MIRKRILSFIFVKTKITDFLKRILTRVFVRGTDQKVSEPGSKGHIKTKRLGMEETGETESAKRWGEGEVCPQR